MKFDCPICYMNFSNSDPHILTLCKHYFCYECYHTHIMSNNLYSNTCPLCRTLLFKDNSNNNCPTPVNSTVDYELNTLLWPSAPTLSPPLSIISNYTSRR